ncbi:MAG: arylsulfatase A-like enzyme [Planctomycetota bacterium]|jgi:arylsulfatase A-like enzyme
MLRALPVLVLIAAAIDAQLVRGRLEHAELGADLFGQAVLLWTAFGLLALIPAWPTRWLLRLLCRVERGQQKWAIDAWSLGTWIAFPVLAHQVLDRYTLIGKNIDALMSARPWLEVGGLALGCAVLGTVLAPRLSRLPGGLAAIAGILIASTLGLFGGNDSAPAATTAEAPEGSPNLLLLVWDTTRAKSLSPYGYDRETTPHLAQLADKSVLFEEARSVSCFTLSSHLSMLTGVYPSHHGARLTKMTYNARKTPSIARLLNEYGYRTAGFVGTNVLRANTGMVDGFELYDDQVDPPVCSTSAWKLVHDVQSILAGKVSFLRGNGNPHWFEDFFRPAPEVLSAARKWIAADDPRPWFCFVNMYDVHHPYVPEPGSRDLWVRAYDGDIDGYLFRGDNYHKPDGIRDGARLTPADDRHLSDLYDAEMYQLDREVHAFLEAINLEQSNTAVVLTSDHGEAFGERKSYEHNDITEPQVRIPFLVYTPTARGDAIVAQELQARPARRSGKVSGVDVATTLAGLAGLKDKAVEKMTGLDVLAAEVSQDRVVLVEDRDKLKLANTHYAIYHEHWKLVRTGVGESATFELFDLRSDPVGQIDVSASQGVVLETLKVRLDSEREPWGGHLESWEASSGVQDRGLKGLGYTGE